MKSQKKHIEIRSQLISKLINEKVFWSYNISDTEINTISDSQLISLTLRYLDLNEINSLKKIFTISKMKEAWIKYLIPEGEYLHTLNRFLAWYYFDIKKPDIYLKSMQTRHINKLIKYEP